MNKGVYYIIINHLTGRSLDLFPYNFHLRLVQTSFLVVALDVCESMHFALAISE